MVCIRIIHSFFLVMGHGTCKHDSLYSRRKHHLSSSFANNSYQYQRVILVAFTVSSIACQVCTWHFSYRRGVTTQSN